MLHKPLEINKETITKKLRGCWIFVMTLNVLPGLTVCMLPAMCENHHAYKMPENGTAKYKTFPYFKHLLSILQNAEWQTGRV